jgi:DNA-binding transcriptional LysR family regulator
VAILASPAVLHERFDPLPLYKEKFHIAFHEGHEFYARAAIPFRALDGQNYLRRYNCEFRDLIAEELQAQGCSLSVCYQSEREDWIQTMVASGFGICFLPEFNALAPGLHLRPVVEPEIWRDVQIVTMAGRRFSPALLAFMKTARTFPWPQSAPGPAA